MHNRTWLLPSLLLTILTIGTTLAVIPQFSGLLPALRILPSWMISASLIVILYRLILMMRGGVKSPIGELRSLARREWQHTLFLAFFMAVAGLNLIAFMWIKPLLNYHVPFWADPILADVDHVIFLGHEPWKLLSWMNVPWAGTIYHPAWFIGMIIALMMTASAPPSDEKSAILLSYFLLWSLVAPAIHILLPAAGPIFYERMGYGPRFNGLDGGPQTTAVGDYLWAIYSSRSFGAGSGISAMPSMHVTISCWTIIAINFCAPRWRGVAVCGWAVIFMLSISLGWHYAMDGIIGTIAALACYYIVLHLYRARFILGQLPVQFQPVQKTVIQPLPSPE